VCTWYTARRRPFVALCWEIEPGGVAVYYPPGSPPVRRHRPRKGCWNGRGRSVPITPGGPNGPDYEMLMEEFWT